MGVTIGIDVGVASVGIAVVDSETREILEAVSDIFPCANAASNADRRGFRQGRRGKRRLATRISDFKSLWIKSGYKIPDDTNLSPLKLRVLALNEKISMEELYVVLLNNMKHRGISYLEDADDGVSGGGDYIKGLKINQDELKTKFPCEIQLERLEQYGKYRGQQKIEENGENVVLSNVFTVSAYRKEISKILEVQKSFHSELTDIFIKEYFNIFNRKRKYYEGPGNEKSRTDYGKYTTHIDYQTGEYVTEANIFEKLIGKCSVYKNEMRASAASYTAQEFNLLNDLNNITIGGRKIEEYEKRKIVELIKSSERPVVEKIICSVTKEDADTIEGARIDKNEKRIYHSFEAYRKMRSALREMNVDIDDFSREELDEIGRVLTLNTELEGVLNTLSISNIVFLEENIVECLVNLRKKNGALFNKWHSFSAKIMLELIPIMYEQPKEQMQLLSDMGVLKAGKEKYKGLKYIPENIVAENLYNPVVVRSIQITVRAINALIKKYGYPDKIVIEMPRDKNDEEEKKRIKDEQLKNEKELADIIKTIKREYDIHITDLTFRNRKGLRLKLKLWNEQGGICPYSGKRIEIENLLRNPELFEVDHIIPLSISFDDGRNNKVLVYATENQEKGNRTPYGYLSSISRSWGWEQFRNKIFELKYQKRIPGKKVENFLFCQDIQKLDVLKGFINRNLNDTRYASRTVLNELQSFFEVNKTGTDIFVIRGSFTSQMRKNMKLDKNRDESYSHHAVDALLIAYSKMGYDAFYQLQGKFIDFETGEILDNRMWDEKMTPEIYKAYLYGNKWSHIRDNILQAEKNVKYWYMVDRKCNRSLCKQTIYGTREYEGKIYKINSTGDIHTDDGYKKFKNIVEKNPNRLLVSKHDAKTFEMLMQIFNEYADAKNPFVQYEKETGDKVRKYAKLGNGPVIGSLKYEDGEANSCIDVSHKYGHKKGSKKVVLMQLNPYRSDVYFHLATGKYYIIGIKQSDVICKGGKHVISKEAYTKILREERMIDNTQTIDDLESLGYQFRISFFKNDIIQYEKTDNYYTERFLSRTMPQSRNYIETKPLDRAKFKGKNQNLIGLSATSSIKKIRTDILGNRYVCEKEKFTLECE